MPPEKRLALDQVPLVGGGGGAGASILKKIEATSTVGFATNSTIFVPVTGHTLNFTLDVDQEVILSATGSITHLAANAFDTDVTLGLRIDGTDFPIYQWKAQASELDVDTFNVRKVAALLAGAHTVDLVVKDNNGAPNGGNWTVQGLETPGAGPIPRQLTAVHIDPVFGVGSLTKLEAIAQGGGNFSTNSLTFVPIPGTQVIINLANPQTVILLGYATKERLNFLNENIGIRVTSPGPSVIDLAGTQINSSIFLAGFDLPLPISRAISLPAGSHTAELVLKTILGGQPALVRTIPTAPAVMTAIFTNPEEIVKITSIPPEIVNAGDISLVGILGEAARADHEHGVATAAPVDTGQANAEGGGTDLARATHVHRTLVEIQDAGAVIASRPKVNFIGATAVVDDGGNDRVNVTVTPAVRIITFKFTGQGKVVVGTKIDGTWVAGRAFTITRITLHRETAGGGGTTIVDVNKGGVSLFTTQANRPQIAFGAGNDQIAARTNMDIVAVAQDDKITIDVDQAETGNPADITVTIEGEIA